MLDLIPVKAIQKVKHMSDVMGQDMQGDFWRGNARCVMVEADTGAQQSAVDVQLDGDGKDIMSIMRT